MAQNSWTQAVASDLAQSLTDELWANVRRSRPQNGLCDQLEALAAAIEKAGAEMHDLVGGVTAQALKLFGQGQMVTELGRELAAQIALPFDGALVVVARRLRVTGVYICTINNELEKCRCLQSLAKGCTEEVFTDVLTTALSSHAAI